MDARTPYSRLPLWLLACGLTGCMAIGPADVVPHDADPRTKDLAQTADDLERLSEDQASPAATHSSNMARPFIGRGFAQVGTQSGRSINERRLMAIRAARLEALRDLTEQVHGIAISSTSNLQDATLRDDRINGIVAGKIRGAEIVSITALDSDSFEVVMSLSPDTVRYILRAARAGI